MVKRIYLREFVIRFLLSIIVILFASFVAKTIYESKKDTIESNSSVSVEILNSQYDNLKKGTADSNLFIIEYNGYFNKENSDNFARKVDFVLVNHKEGDVVMLKVESFGGETPACGSSYEQVERLKANGITVIGVSDYVAASCGYYLLSSSDHILTGYSSDIGNVGVASTFGNANNVIATSPIKKAFSGGQPSREGLMGIYFRVKESKDIFVEQVIKGRKGRLDDNRSKEIFSGAFFTGKRALELGMIDAISDSRTIKMDYYQRGYDLILLNHL